MVFKKIKKYRNPSILIFNNNKALHLKKTQILHHKSKNYKVIKPLLLKTKVPKLTTHNLNARYVRNNLKIFDLSEDTVRRAIQAWVNSLIRENKLEIRESMIDLNWSKQNSATFKFIRKMQLSTRKSSEGLEIKLH